jgi:hypothetical protein
MEDFKDILDMATVDGGYMLIDNMTDSTDICDIVYRYSQPVTGSMKKITAMTACNCNVQAQVDGSFCSSLSPLR